MFINIVSFIRENKMEEPLYKRIIIIFLLLFKAHFALIANNYTIQDIEERLFERKRAAKPSRNWSSIGQAQTVIGFFEEATMTTNRNVIPPS